MSDVYWWIAINGSSCAASSVPLPRTPEVRPIPELLVGFRTQDEQLEAQTTCLTAPLALVREFMDYLTGREARGEVIVCLFPNHEPQTDGPTAWLAKGGGQ